MIFSTFAVRNQHYILTMDNALNSIWFALCHPLLDSNMSHHGALRCEIDSNRSLSAGKNYDEEEPYSYYSLSHYDDCIFRIRLHFEEYFWGHRHDCSDLCCDHVWVRNAH